jgi:predicted ATPase
VVELLARRRRLTSGWCGFKSREHQRSPSTPDQGTANRMGRAAAHVSNSLGQLQPLFIYGGVGLGKTHLMHAIGNKLVAGNNRVYLHPPSIAVDVNQGLPAQNVPVEFRALTTRWTVADQ